LEKHEGKGEEKEGRFEGSAAKKKEGSIGGRERKMNRRGRRGKGRLSEPGERKRR